MAYSDSITRKVLKLAHSPHQGALPTPYRLPHIDFLRYYINVKSFNMIWVCDTLMKTFNSHLGTING